MSDQNLFFSDGEEPTVRDTDSNGSTSVENKFDFGPTSSSSCSTPSRKRRVPEKVRVSSERVSN